MGWLKKHAGGLVRIGVGGLIGGGAGAIEGGGSQYAKDRAVQQHTAEKSAEYQQKLLISNMNNRVQRTKANINLGYGIAPPIAAKADLDTAHRNQALIDNSVERNTGLVRDSAAANNIAGAEGAAREASFSAASSGLGGSSPALSAKRRVLGGYLQGRAGVASSAMGMRVQGRNALEQERLGLLGKVNGQTETDYAGHIANLDLVSNLRQASQQVVPNTVGQGIGDLGSILSSGILYRAQGMQGLNSFALPSLSGGRQKPTGGLQMGGNS